MVAFIINPQAGNGAALHAWHKFAKTIHFPYEQYVTEHSGHATQLVEALKARQQKMLLVGFGGDGTMREITAGAAGSDLLIVASIPAGSGNDFARTFSHFTSAAEISNFLRQPNASATDIGVVCGKRHHYFASSSGIGFDAAVSFAVNQSRIKRWLNKLRLGKMAYLVFVISTLASFRTFRLTVEFDGETFHFDKVWLATVSNQPYFGGGMKISPQSKTDDGQLELTIVHHLPRLKLLAVFGTVFSGSHTRFQEVVQLSSRGFLLSTDQPVPRHLDGDDAGTTNANEKLHYCAAANKWQQAKLQ